MKAITIPERFGYPTVDITVNGIEHTLETGVEVEVEDNVAAVVENALALAPKYASNLSKFAQRIEGSITEITASDFEGIESIGGYAFLNCKSLKSIEIPSNITSIGISAFSGCSLLNNIAMGKSVTSIGNYAFYNCSSLTSIEIPNSVTSIGSEVFYGCVKLENIALPETPPTLANVNSFQNIKSSCVFYCKTQASLNAYKEAPNWSTLTGTYTFAVGSK